VFTHNKTLIRSAALQRGLKLYNKAIVAALGAMLSRGGSDPRYDGDGQWLDLGGADQGLVVGEHRGVGVLLLERMEDVHGLEHGARDIGIVFVETDHVAFDRAAVAGGPLHDVAHGAESW